MGKIKKTYKIENSRGGAAPPAPQLATGLGVAQATDIDRTIQGIYSSTRVSFNRFISETSRTLNNLNFPGTKHKLL